MRGGTAVIPVGRPWGWTTTRRGGRQSTHPGECVLCYVHRMVTAFGCDAALGSALARPAGAAGADLDRPADRPRGALRLRAVQQWMGARRQPREPRTAGA